MTRTYLAWGVRCPLCHAAPLHPCAKPDGTDMAGVHRVRDQAYNALHGFAPAGLAARDTNEPKEKRDAD